MDTPIPRGLPFLPHVGQGLSHHPIPTALVKWTDSCVLEKEGHSGEGQTAKDWWEVESKPEGRALGSRLETQWSQQSEMRS